jgi:putative membrane protein
MKITKLQAATYALTVAGAALFAGLMLHQGVREVGTAFASTGWWLLVIVGFHAVPMLADVQSWRALFPEIPRPRFLDLYLCRWAGESVSNLLPVAHLGGEFVRTRLVAIRSGVRMSTVAATVIVEITIGVLTQILFSLAGVITLVAVTGHSRLLGPFAAASVVAALLVAVFYAIQRIGIFRILDFIVSRMVDSERWQALARGGESIDRMIHTLYGRRAGIMAATAWIMSSWVLGIGEFWIALHAMGARADFATALIMESAVQTVRGALFMLPGALGFQEAGFLGIGALLHLTPEISLALSLVKRVRELALGIAGLIIWHSIEGRHLLKRGGDKQPATI